MPKKVLVVGSGGREHALANRLLASESVTEVIVNPGNAGTAQGAPQVPGKLLRNVAGAPLAIALAEKVDLVVIGPEVPLCEGLVDELSAHNILAFGPNRQAAALEGSKAFMKDFAARHGLPTAKYRVVRALAELPAALAAFEAPPVVKADGLCAGKGVVVADSFEEARDAAADMLSGARFGEAGKTVVLEERIAGQELSLHAICDGERWLFLPGAQDHKRIGDGDTGANTGGMGTYAPAPLATAALLDKIRSRIFDRTLAGFHADALTFRGVLFAGIMVTPEGEPQLLEFNVRFGDPETQVLCQVLDGDWGLALESAARGQLNPGELVLAARAAVCVVLAARGYPAAAEQGDVISGLDTAAGLSGVQVFHAGTKHAADGSVVVAGGRVLGVTAQGPNLQAARDLAYQALAQIQFAGMQFRQDIAVRGLSS